LRKFICLLILSLLIFSCYKNEVSYLPFEVNHNITCDDLYEDGFRRTFGVDVVLIGKKMNDTVIHYQIDYPLYNIEFNINDLEENILVEIDTIKKVSEYDKYLKQDALELNDSIYEFVYGSIKKQKKDICNNGSVSWRNFILKIKQSEIKNFRNRIDTSKYKILDLQKESNYSIEEFEVVNLVTKDRFYCSIYEQNKNYYFSSTFTLINYD